MKWNDSEVGQFIDDKVKELDYPFTAVLIGEWNAHNEISQEIERLGLPSQWFGACTNTYGENMIPMYFIAATETADGDKILALFESNPNFVFGRFYKKEKAIKSLVKKKSS